MKTSPLVGQTFLLSPRNLQDGGNDTRQRKILRQFMSDGIRYYEVEDPLTGEKFPALADVYDRLFLLARQTYKRKFTKGDACFTPTSVNYSLRN